MIDTIYKSTAMNKEEILQEEIRKTTHNSISNYLTDSGIWDKDELIYRCMDRYATQEKQPETLNSILAPYLAKTSLDELRKEWFQEFPNGVPSVFSDQEKQAWVKTSERLPEESDDTVLVTDKWGGMVVAVWNHVTKTNCTHWMPLPPKPEV